MKQNCFGEGLPSNEVAMDAGFELLATATEMFVGVGGPAIDEE